MKKQLLLFGLLFIASAVANAGNVTIADNSFTPTSISVTKGEDVVFTWTGANMHNVTPVTPGQFTASPTQSSGTYTISTSSMALGTYNYYCTIHGAAVMSGSFTITAATGFLSAEATGLFSAYPNPVENILTLSTTDNSSKKIDAVKILSLDGKEMANYSLSTFGTEFQIDLSALNEGFYICRIYSNGAVVDTRKIVKKK